MKRIIPLALGILFIATIVIAAPPQHGPGGAALPPPPPGAGPGPDAQRALGDYLELTDSQKAAAEAIHSELRTSTESLREQMHALHEQLETALEGNDASSIGNLMLQIRGVRTQLEAARQAADAKFIALLTTEQKTKFEAFQAAVEFLRERGPGGGEPHP